MANGALGVNPLEIGQVAMYQRMAMKEVTTKSVSGSN